MHTLLVHAQHVLSQHGMVCVAAILALLFLMPAVAAILVRWRFL